MVRFKNRYLVIEVNPISGTKNKFLLKQSSLYFALHEKLQTLHGDFGVAAVRSGLLVKYCNEYTRIAVIRARHGPHRLVASCLPLITQVERVGVTLKTLYTGATLIHCNKFITKHQKEELQKISKRLLTEEDKKKFQEAFFKLTPVK